MTADDFTLPLIDLVPFLASNTSNEEAALASCRQISDALHHYGAFVIRDPRVTFDDNQTFLSMMESYFEQSNEVKQEDIRKESHYQVGVTPELMETPRCTFDPACLEIVEKLSEENKPILPTGPDPKWRYFWRIGDRPKHTKYPELNSEQVVPKAFPQWSDVMNRWGSLMLQAVRTVSEMAAIGFGLPKDTFTTMTNSGPHLLAPTGSDLSKYGEKNTVFAGFHYDLNFLTIHGKSKFPGLYIWTRSGHRLPVRIPDGCLLVQAGKQFEYVTAGYVQAGYHEVIVTDATLNAIEKAKENGASLWRISSTAFLHVASDCILKPVEGFAEVGIKEKGKYEPIECGEFVQRELQAIQLKAK